MIFYQAEFVALVCVLFAVEIMIGLALNLYNMVRWYNVKTQKAKHRKNGNNFIITLKFMDLLICGTAIPFAFAALIVKSDRNLVVCFIKEGLVMFASSGSSFCVMLISLDRYIAIVWPTKNLLTPHRILTFKVIAVLFALIGLALPSLSLLMGYYYNARRQSVYVLPCRHVVWIFKPNYFYEIYYIFSFLIAVITTFLCYHSVLKVVRRRLLQRVATVTSTSAQTQKDTLYINRFRRQEFRATRLAFAVVVSFLVCWGPHVIITIIQLTLVENLIIDMIQSVCLVIAFLAPIIHPVIYTYETNDRREPSIFSKILMCGSWVKGGNRVTPEQTHINTVKISSPVVIDGANVISNMDDLKTSPQQSKIFSIKSSYGKTTMHSDTESVDNGHSSDGYIIQNPNTSVDSRTDNVGDTSEHKTSDT